MSKVTSVEFAKALADETRQKIMQACCCRGRAVNELVEEMGVSQPTVSHHLARLSEAGLVTARAESYYSIYRLETDALESMADGVGNCIDFDNSAGSECEPI